MVLIFVEPTSVIKVGREIKSDKEEKIFLYALKGVQIIIRSN